MELRATPGRLAVAAGPATFLRGVEGPRDEGRGGARDVSAPPAGPGLRRPAGRVSVRQQRQAGRVPGAGPRYGPRPRRRRRPGPSGGQRSIHPILKETTMNADRRTRERTVREPAWRDRPIAGSLK